MVPRFVVEPVSLAPDIEIAVVDSCEHSGAPAGLDLDRVHALLRHTLDALAIAGPAELHVEFVDEATMTELNATHMGGDGPTDVLSFPLDYADHARPEPVPTGPPSMLGDIVVCPPVAHRQAAETDGRTYASEVDLLLVHGVLHLLGHDHAEPGETELMQDHERRILRGWSERS